MRITEELAARMVELCQGAGVTMDDAVAEALEDLLRARSDAHGTTPALT